MKRGRPGFCKWSGIWTEESYCWRLKSGELPKTIKTLVNKYWASILPTVGLFAGFLPSTIYDGWFKDPFFTKGLISPVFYDIQKTTFVYSCTPDWRQQQQQQQQQQQRQQRQRQRQQRQQQQFNVSLFFNKVCFGTSAQLKWFYYFNDACSFSLFSSWCFQGDFHRMSTAGPTPPQGDAPLVSGGHVSDLVGHCSVSLATRWGRYAVAGIRGKCVDLRRFCSFEMLGWPKFHHLHNDCRIIELSFFFSRSSPVGNEKQIT